MAQFRHIRDFLFAHGFLAQNLDLNDGLDDGPLNRVLRVQKTAHSRSAVTGQRSILH